MHFFFTSSSISFLDLNPDKKYFTVDYISHTLSCIICCECKLLLISGCSRPWSYLYTGFSWESIFRPPASVYYDRPSLSVTHESHICLSLVQAFCLELFGTFKLCKLQHYDLLWPLAVAAVNYFFTHPAKKKIFPRQHWNNFIP